MRDMREHARDQQSRGPAKQAQPQVPYLSTARRRPLLIPARGRQGMAVIGKPDKVEELANSIRKIRSRKAADQQSDRGNSFGRKGRVGEIGDCVPSLGANRRTITARVVCEYKVTLKQMPARR